MTSEPEFCYRLASLTIATPHG